jgi:hypothetical protein
VTFTESIKFIIPKNKDGNLKNFKNRKICNGLLREKKERKKKEKEKTVKENQILEQVNKLIYLDYLISY